MINIQNHVLPETSGSKQASQIAAPNKRRHHVTEPSDEEDRNFFLIGVLDRLLLRYPFLYPTKIWITCQI